MAAITYTARRSLIAGHVAGESYSFDQPLSAATPSAQSDRSRHVAMDGTTETVFNRVESRWQITTTILDSDGLRQMREFLDSALGGEAFTLDVYGTQAAPDSPTNVLLESDSYSVERVGTGHMYRVSFEVREL